MIISINKVQYIKVWNDKALRYERTNMFHFKEQSSFCLIQLAYLLQYFMLILLISQDALESKMLSDFKIPIYEVKKKIYTARKVSIFGAFLVRIFPHSDWIRRDTKYLSVFSPKAEIRNKKNPNTDTFHAVIWLLLRAFP